MKNLRKSTKAFLIALALLVLAIGGYFYFKYLGIQADSLALKQKIILVNQTPLFEIKAENAQLDTAKNINDINTSIPAGGKQSVNFALSTSAEALTNLTGSAKSLRVELKKTALFPENPDDSSDPLVKGYIDDRLVYFWNQKVVDQGTRTSLGIKSIPELLVKTDSTNYMSPNIGLAENELLNKDGYTSTSQKDDNLNFILGPNNTKNIILTISVPKDTIAGSYSSTLSIIDSSKSKTLRNINLNIEVEDFKLDTLVNSEARVGCYINDMIKKNDQVEDKIYHISPTLFEQRLRIVKRNGCQMLKIRADDNTDVATELEQITNLGFSGPAIIDFNRIYYDPIDTQASQKQFLAMITTQILNNPKSKVPISWYGIDEPDTSDEYAKQIARTNNISQILAQTNFNQLYGPNVNNDLAGQIVTSTTTDVSIRLFNEGPQFQTKMTMENANYRCSFGQWINPNCKVPFQKRLEYIRDSANNSGQEILGKPKYEMYYFQGYPEAPLINRLVGGLGFVNSGFKGYFMNPVYGYFNNDTAPYYAEDKLLTWHKQNMTFYPASDGFIPTIQSEGWREGVTDIRYYYTLKALIDQAKTKYIDKGGKLKEINDISNELTRNVSAYQIDGALVSLPANISAQTFENTRRLMINDIKIIKALL